MTEKFRFKLVFILFSGVFLSGCSEKVVEVPNKKGLGIFYWEPEGARSWSRYGLSAWGADGRPTHAMDAFLVN